MFDLHCDTFLELYFNKKKLHTNDLHIDLEKLNSQDAIGQCFAMFVDLGESKEPFTVCNEMMDLFDQELKENEKIIEQARTTQEITQLQGKNKLAAYLTIEEGGVLEGSMEKLHHFHQRGVKAITLTWNYENEIGYPNCRDDFKDLGLKPFGLELIKEMNRLGIVIDVSHLSDGGFWDCIKHSTKPIVATHSNARSLCNHSRNLTDEMILALRDQGGITGINFCSAFINGTGYTPVKDLVKHINYIRDLAGIDVIAMGTDFDGITSQLEIKDMSHMHLLKEALVDEGYTNQDIDKIFYKNALRVFKANE